MPRAMVEEASDSEPELAVPDPDDADIDDFVESDIPPRAPPYQNLGEEQFKSFQSLYPIYFDASRSRAQGRRVGAKLAVSDPLARDIAAACSALGLPTLLEQEKTHPKDWANPGRVKVGLKHSVSGLASNLAAADAPRNKHALYLKVAHYLARHPTTEQSAGLRVRMPAPDGGPPEIQPPLDKPYPQPAVPHGWKIGRLVPYHSPAMTGGGVSDNFLKDMMKEMQGGGDPMAALMASQQGDSHSAPPKKKKDKKGKGKA